MGSFEKKGFEIFKQKLPTELITKIKSELIKLSNTIEKEKYFKDENEFWNWCKLNNRQKGGTLYNGFKHLNSVQYLAASKEITKALSEIGIKSPALIDINCRIDSNQEEKFLFGWHQDYWFSIASKNAVVVWIPINEITPELGGLDVISNEHTNGKVFNTIAGNKYNSYADAVLLDDTIPSDQKLTINSMSPGDILIFKFNVLHKSNPVSSKTKSRFTIQLRFADFDDPEFLDNKYKPGVVLPEKVEYLTEDI